MPSKIKATVNALNVTTQPHPPSGGDSVDSDLCGRRSPILMLSFLIFVLSLFSVIQTVSFLHLLIDYPIVRASLVSEIYIFAH